MKVAHHFSGGFRFSRTTRPARDDRTFLSSLPLAGRTFTFSCRFPALRTGLLLSLSPCGIYRTLLMENESVSQRRPVRRLVRQSLGDGGSFSEGESLLR
jgi:hypothetical protein